MDQAPYVCDKCGKQVGVLMDIEGTQFLKAGDVLLREGHGVCVHCNGQVHWSVPDSQLQRLIDRVLDMRGKYN